MKLALALPLASMVSVGCASTQALAGQSVSTRETVLTVALPPGEDVSHALSVATRRLAAAGVSHADLTAAGESLSARLRESELARAREALTATAWVRARLVDERVDLSEAVPTPAPEGVEVVPEAVTLAPGMVLRGAAVRGPRAALEALAQVGEGRLTVIPAGARWQLVALEPRVLLGGAQVTRCARRGARVVALELGPEVAALRERERGRERRVVYELPGAVAAASSLHDDPAIELPSEEAATSLLRACESGLLRGPLREDRQSPSQGTGSSVAP
ncbi:MAG: hypothetical protein R3A48_09310 [Polyangiales bacterium]